MNSLPDLRVLCFTEHRLRLGASDSVSLTNFELISAFCRTVHVHGGTSIYLHEILKRHEIVNIKNKSRQIHCEITGIYAKKLDLVVVYGYRSPCKESDFQIFLDTVHSVMLHIDGDSRVILCGHFNLKFIDPDLKTKQLIDLLTQFNLDCV